MKEKEEMYVKRDEKIVKEIEKGNAENLVSIPFSRIPLTQWAEWNEDCKKNFQGMRWVKAYTDHFKAKNSEENAAIWKKIAEIEALLQQALAKPEEVEEEGVKNLAGEVIA